MTGISRSARISAAALAVAASLMAPAAARDKQAAGNTGTATDNAPLQMMVSLKEQRINVYRGTELVTSSPISSGKTGHATPTGVFSILEKRRKHFSNLYDDAPMPFMQRLTWSGVALHEGRVPGYPASHGCIRLPRAFAQDLFGLTERGLHVVVTQDEAVPHMVYSAALPQPIAVGSTVASLSPKMIEADPALRGSIETGSIQPDVGTANEIPENFNQPLRMIVTPRAPENQIKTLQRLLGQMGFDAGPADGVAGRKTRAAIESYQEGADLPVTGRITDGLVRSVYADAGYVTPTNAVLRIRRKFKDIYEAGVTLKEPAAPIGTHVFTALGFEHGATRTEWMGVAAEGTESGTPEEALARLEISEPVRRELGQMLTPGSSLIITDRSFARNTGLGTDFVVITK
ncbi:L,D-transpeptidase family protein [Roseibium litorale]|uniref:L,D-transpeptidase family protein n=1 Tax=Roseibium litorale TaxID=2803841 RepID=UPI0024841497|nr:L,D-transpeptidase family protein [Roseibium litorale]